MIVENYNIIFDLDGTLVHSVPDMHYAIVKTLSKYNLNPISETKLQTFVGQGMLSLSKRVVDYCGGDESLYELVYKDYRQNYSEQPYKYSSLMAGVKETLEFFYKKNVPMGICTNKRQFVTERLIDQMNLKKYFNVVIGARDNVPLKPKPDMLILAMQQFKSIKKSYLMVGDTLNDVNAAKAANIKSAVIAGGYTDININELGANYTLENMRDITTLFKIN